MNQLRLDTGTTLQVNEKRPSAGPPSAVTSSAPSFHSADTTFDRLCHLEFPRTLSQSIIVKRPTSVPFTFTLLKISFPPTVPSKTSPLDVEILYLSPSRTYPASLQRPSILSASEAITADGGATFLSTGSPAFRNAPAFLCTFENTDVNSRYGTSSSLMSP